jgi:hypothetical protein
VHIFFCVVFPRFCRGFCKKRGTKRGFLHGDCGEYRGEFVVVGSAKFGFERCATFGIFIFGLTIFGFVWYSMANSLRGSLGARNSKCNGKYRDPSLRSG